MASSKAKRELAEYRKGTLAATMEIVDLFLRDGYEHNPNGAAAVVNELAINSARQHGIDPELASEILERVYVGAVDVFGSSADPHEFVNAGYERIKHVLAIAAIKREASIETQNASVEGRLKNQIGTYASGVAPDYGLDPKEAYRKAVLFVDTVVLPAFREIQERLRQTPSGSL